MISIDAREEPDREAKAKEQPLETKKTDPRLNRKTKRVLKKALRKKKIQILRI